MSYILESIKQAERERRLGEQQSPAISIEYTSEYVDDIGKKKSLWLVLLFGLLVIAVAMWVMKNHFINENVQPVEELSLSRISEPLVPEENFDKRSIAMVPVKNLHSSELKSVKLITENDKYSITEELETTDQIIDQKIDNPKIASATEFVQPKKYPTEIDAIKPIENKVVDKQELVEIYSDLANSPQPVSIASEDNELKRVVSPELVQIEEASYKPPIETTVVPSNAELRSYRQQHERAVSTGVPSFGELPYEIQEKIPEFNVSVHMFHADPVQRRIRINGQMYREGKSLEQDLALVEITRYGAVFDFQGHLFRFNVR